MSSILSLLIVISAVSAAPVDRDGSSGIQPVRLSIAMEEQETPLKVISIMSHKFGILDTDTNGLKYAYIKEGRPAHAELSIRVAKKVSMMHAHITYTLQSLNKEYQESKNEVVKNLERVCPEGGVAHAFSCEKEAVIKTLKLSLPTNWEHPEDFQGDLSTLTIAMTTPDQLTLFNITTYVWVQ